MRLGDKIESALKTIGITPELVEQWLGSCLGCKERQEKLNQLGCWASRVLSGKTIKARWYFDEITSQESAVWDEKINQPLPGSPVSKG